MHTAETLVKERHPKVGFGNLLENSFYGREREKMSQNGESGNEVRDA